MFNSVGREQQFAIGSEVLEVVREYIYLGQVVTADPNHETEVTGNKTGVEYIWQVFSDHEWQFTSIPQEKSI